MKDWTQDQARLHLLFRDGDARRLRDVGHVQHLALPNGSDGREGELHTNNRSGVRASPLKHAFIARPAMRRTGDRLCHTSQLVPYPASARHCCCLPHRAPSSGLGAMQVASPSDPV